MIIVAGQFYFEFTVPGFDDFLGAPELKFFKIVESAGNTIPKFALSFESPQKDLLRLLHQGVRVEFKIGESPDAFVGGALRIVAVQSRPVSEQINSFLITGFYDALAFNSNPRLRTTGKQSGIETIEETVTSSGLFRVDNQSQNSSERMSWIQSNKSDRMFLTEVWLHSYIPDSFPLVAITLDGRYLIRDIVTLTDPGRPTDWDFVNSGVTQEEDEEDKQVIYLGDYTIESKSGFMNHLQVSGRYQVVYDMEQGRDEIITEKVSPLLGLVQESPKDPNLTPRIAKASFNNDNIDRLYWNAELRNIQGLALFSSLSLTLSTVNKWKNIHPLDLVHFSDAPIRADRIDDAYRGRWIVSKVTRSLTSNSINTTITLSRDSVNAAVLSDAG